MAEEKHIEGFRLLLRCEELWRLQQRAQQFFNWFSKLPLECKNFETNWHVGFLRLALTVSGVKLREGGQMLEVASAWRIDLTMHVIRKHTYRGQRAQVLQDRIRLGFDALTLPASFFADAWLIVHDITIRPSVTYEIIDLCSEVASCLQVRGCKPALQKSSMATLAVLIQNCMPSRPTLQLATMPGIQECHPVARGSVESPDHSKFSSTCNLRPAGGQGWLYGPGLLGHLPPVHRSVPEAFLEMSFT